MFSIFKNGITKIYPEKQPIVLSDLAKLIKNNPAAEIINQLRQMRLNGDQTYKELKRSLTYITPNCVVKKRSLKDGTEYDTNFINFSGYIYFDFDVPNPIQFQQEFIQKYKHIVSLVCISSGGGGISVLVKVNIDLTKENFQSVWEYIASEFFKDKSSILDTKTKDIGRAMFLSSDPDVFINHDNELLINPTDLLKYGKTETIKKGTQQGISTKRYNYTSSCTFSYQLLPYDEIRKVNLSTPINSNNPVVDYNPISFSELKFPDEVSDGIKHKFYSSLIHVLVHLNPDLDPSYIYSFLFYNNKYKAVPPMESRSLKRLFEYVYHQTKEEGYVYNNDRIKNFHLNKDTFLSKEEKIKIMNKCNGMIRKNKSIDKILEAKAELKSRNEKITQYKVSEVSGLGIQTVKKYYRVENVYDINSLVDDINSQYLNNSNSTINYHKGFTSTITDELFDEYCIEVKIDDENYNKDGSSLNQWKVQ
jgi:hypothetical protein